MCHNKYGYYTKPTQDCFGYISRNDTHWNGKFEVGINKTAIIQPQSLFTLKARVVNNVSASIITWWDITATNCTSLVRQLSED